MLRLCASSVCCYACVCVCVCCTLPLKRRFSLKWAACCSSCHNTRIKRLTAPNALIILTVKSQHAKISPHLLHMLNKVIEAQQINNKSLLKTFPYYNHIHTSLNDTAFTPHFTSIMWQIYNKPIKQSNARRWKKGEFAMDRGEWSP